MGQGTQKTTFPEQGQPGTGPGQKGQEPQHQSEHGLQPIKDLPANCEENNQARQNQNDSGETGHHQGEQNKPNNPASIAPRDPDQSGVGSPEKGPQKSGAF